MKTDALEAIEMLGTLTWEQASAYAWEHDGAPPLGWTFVDNISHVNEKDWCFAIRGKGYLVRTSAL